MKHGVDFSKVIKPEFVKRHSFNPEIRVNIDDNIYTIERRMCGLAVEEEDKIIAESIIRIAKEHGITDLYLLNKKAIVEALQKQIPKKVEVKRWMCTECECGYEFSKHHGDGYYSIPYTKQTKYCPNCGQALDWGQEE